MKPYFVTAILVVRNEENYIIKSLESFLNQDYPKDSYELIIVDGDSTDKTLDNIQSTIESYQNTNKDIIPIKILRNQKKLLASGWNLAIKNARGSYVTRIDAHAKADKSFISKSIETIKSVSDVICVGGKLETLSLTSKGKVITKVLSSPFGIGNSKFRYSDKAQYVDTVAFGLYKKEIFDEVGYFDETLARNQDNNMHSRIKKAGGKFYFNPDIHCIYYSRDTYAKMCRQGYLNGKWNIIGFKKDRNSVSIRHLIPFIFVVSLILLCILTAFDKVFLFLLLAEICLYLTCAVFAAIKKASSLKEFIFMIYLFPCLHISYGTGSLISILKGGN